jgi:hypothetical protein
MTRRPLNRRGYALMLVMLFLVLFSALLGIAWRRVASALRVECVLETRKQADRGSIRVAALVMRLLESRLRSRSTSAGPVAELDVSGDPALPDYRSSYTCKWQIDTSDDPTSQNLQWYRVTLAADTTDGQQWSVGVTAVPPADVLSLPLMPSNPP